MSDRQYRKLLAQERKQYKRNRLMGWTIAAAYCVWITALYLTHI